MGEQKREWGKGMKGGEKKDGKRITDRKDGK